MKSPARSLSLKLASAVIAVAFAAAVFLGLFGDFMFDRRSVAADVSSVSAIGHHGFRDWLVDRGNPVLIASTFTTRRAADRTPMLVLEPIAGDASALLHVAQVRERTARTLLVLPKRSAERDSVHAGWIGPTKLVKAGDVERILSEVEIEAKVTRTSGTSLVDTESYGGVELQLADMQTVESFDLETLVGTSNGALLARCRSRKNVFVLSDPDVLANHGIDELANRVFLDAVIEQVAKDREPVAVDETVHGPVAERDIWREAFRLPLLPATVSFFLAVVAAVLAARRFGAPEPEPSGFASGKRLLIENAAGIQRDVGASDELVERYASMIEDDLARALRVPEAFTGVKRRDEVVRRAAERGIVVEFQVTPADAIGAIRRMHNWLEEIRRGSNDD